MRRQKSSILFFGKSTGKRMKRSRSLFDRKVPLANDPTKHVLASISFFSIYDSTILRSLSADALTLSYSSLEGRILSMMSDSRLMSRVFQ